MDSTVELPEIGVLEVKVLFDISGTSPVIYLTNQTTANPNLSPTPSLASLVWVLNIYSPTGTPIYQSDFDAPFYTGVWTTQTISAPWPKPFSQIEWSGADYRAEFQVKDTDGNIQYLNKAATICRPTGNNKQSTDTYGHVKLTVDVLCEQANLYIKDNTSKTYKGLTGTLLSSFMAVDYPRDPTGVRPDPFETTSFAGDALVPFTFNAKGYGTTCYSVYQYNLGNNCFVNIRYVGAADFDVACNIDLCPIAAEIKDLETQIKTGNCDNIEEAKRKLSLLTPMLLRALIAQRQPSCGIDLPALIEEMKAIGGFTCECANGSTGIGSNATYLSGYLFNLITEGGDISGRFEVDGANINLYLKDKSYTFGDCAGNGTDSISLVPKTTETNTAVCLDIDLTQFATDLYTLTAGNTTLIQLFNDIVNVNTGNLTLSVDGKCIFEGIPSCDYVYSVQEVTTSPDNTILNYIQSNGVQIPVNFTFNISTLSALQNKLNTLGIGTCAVANLGGGNVSITFSSNTFNLGNLTYNFGSADYIATLTKTCGSFAQLSANQVVQYIINYICGITDEKVVTSQAYTVCYADPATGTKETVTVASGAGLDALLTALASAGCSTVDYILASNNGLTCANIKAAFPTSINVLQANDSLYGTKQGVCAPLYPIELGTRIFQLGAYDQNFINAVCNVVSLCGKGKACEAYTVFDVADVQHSPVDNEIDLVITFTHPSAVANNISWARIDNTANPVFTDIPGILPGASPYTVPNLPTGIYRVGLVPVYADGRKCGVVYKDTVISGRINSLSAVVDGTDFTVSYNASVSIPNVRVNVSYPNGGFAQYIYANTGTDITVPIPSGVIGDYSITMDAVYNEDTGFYGLPTAPVVLNVTPPNNTALNNDTGGTLAPVFVYAYPGDGSEILVTSVTSMADASSISMYITPGFYTKIQVAYAGTVVAGELITGSGTYTGAVTTKVGFTDVTVAGSVTINLT